MLVDSHCHLDLFDSCDLEAILERAREKGVEHVLCPGTTVASSRACIQIAKQHEDVSCAIAIHPSETDGHELGVDELINLAQDDVVVAIGETGLDYHYDSVPADLQQERFRRHIQAAIAVGKPLIIHMREASKDCFRLLQEEQATKVGGVMHCFTGTWEEAEQALDLGFYISISGIVTFKKAFSLQDVAKKIPLDKLLIETDAPYLAPEPMRGKQNEPAYVRYVAEFLATMRGISLAELARITTDNFFRLFNV